jgi:hypothetical protein
MASHARSFILDRFRRYPLYGVAFASLYCFPSGASSQEVATQQAKADAISLVQAVKGYRIEYNRLPQLGQTDEKQPVPSEGKLVDILRGLEIRLNPRQITFFDGPTGPDGKPKKITGSSVPDPWNHAYHLHFDWDNDGKLEDPEHPGKTITAVVVAYSAGPDGKYETWGDNIASWK